MWLPHSLKVQGKILLDCNWVHVKRYAVKIFQADKNLDELGEYDNAELGLL